MILTPRDLEIIETLNMRVRMLTLGDLTATWWNLGVSGRKNAAGRLRQLVRAGFLGRADVLAQPMLTLGGPEYAWFPGESPTRFGPLAWRLQSRWSGFPRRTSVYFATARAVDLFGGGAPGRIKNLCQVTHDLHVGTVFLAYRRRWPADAANWIGEDSFTDRRRHRQKIPDALLVNPDGEPYRAVEFGGSYSAHRLSAFHEHCRDRGLPYEIW
ncbi:MAG: hypothetical protein WD875_04600 [Pirellulales bacterium]